MGHDVNYKIEKTQNVIRKRLWTIKHVWRIEDWKPTTNRIKKWNLGCSCNMCKANKQEKKYHREREKNLLIKEINCLDNY